MPTKLAKLTLKVVPGAARTHIAGWQGKQLRVRVSAPPGGGKPNAAVAALIAEVLAVPRRNICIVRGKTSTCKTLQIDGLPESDILSKLNRKLDQ